MNFKIELNTQKRGSNIIFHNIIFDFFKINIVERHKKSKQSQSSLEFALFKIRTIDNNIINTKEGNARFKIKRNHLETYKKLIQILNSYEYKNRLIDRKNAEQKLVDFILSLVISNYAI